VRFFGWRSLSSGSRGSEEGRGGGEGAAACGGRVGGEAAGLILFFPLLNLPTQVLLACLHTLLTLWGGVVGT